MTRNNDRRAVALLLCFATTFHSGLKLKQMSLIIDSWSVCVDINKIIVVIMTVMVSMIMLFAAMMMLSYQMFVLPRSQLKFLI